jgi:probable HAF family extracellular repeat protein
MLAAPLGALAEPVYFLTFLPQNFYASGINNAGHIVGTAGAGAAIWTDTAVTYLGALAPGSEGLAINNHDDIAGRVGMHGFVYSGGVVQDVDSGPYRNWVTGLNDAGRATGTVRDMDGAQARGFIWATDILTPIGPFHSYMDFANAINNPGQVAGFTASPTADFGNPERTAFLYDLFDGVTLLGTLGGHVSEANDLNDSRQVVGWSETSVANEERPFMYVDAAGGMQDLGSLGGRSGRANGINNGGMVVGMSDVGASTGFDYHAFLFANNHMVDLNTLIDPASGWRLVSAADINDAGQILGTACQGTDCRAVRLDMIPGVPEPGAWLILLIGLGLIAYRKCRLRSTPHRPRFARVRKLLMLPLLAGPLGAMAEPIYTVTALPADFSASNMNNSGSIVGTMGAAAAVWTSSGITDIGTLAPESFGYGINNRGDIAGTWQGDAFVYSGGALRNIGRLGTWGTSTARGANDAGQVIGNGFYEVGERQRGFVYTGGVIRIIPTFGGDWSYAAAINSSGQVAGIATIDSADFINPTRHAILYQDRVMHDLGSLGGVVSEAYDINDAGQAVGMSQTNPDDSYSPSHAFLYEGGAMIDLGFLGGANARANGINNAGLVVGWSELGGEAPPTHAFLYANHAMVDLNALIDPASGWEIMSAIDINDARQILATACRLGECTTVRMDLINAVPEPRAWGTLLAGMLLLGGLRRGRRPLVR